MKNLITVIILALLSACSNVKEKEIPGNEIEIKDLNDSIVQLIILFQQNQDSSVLKSALLLNDKVMKMDSVNAHRYYNLNTRIQILGLLNRKKEAFLLKEQTLNKDSLNIDNLIYYGLKHKLKGEEAFSKKYFEKALNRCNELMKDSASTELLLQKVYIYIYQNKDDEAKKVIDDALLKDTDNDILETFRENFEDISKQSYDFLSDIKL